MMSDSYRSQTLWMHLTATFWLCFHLATFLGANGDHLRVPSTLSVSAPHLTYICPEGADVKLLCAQRGAMLHPTDHLQHIWLFTPHQNDHCQDRVHPRGGVASNHNHGNHPRVLPEGVQYGAGEELFWVNLQNVTPSDQGRYCCLTLDLQVDHSQGKVLQRTHSHILLTITPRRKGIQNCTAHGPTVPEGSVSAGLSTAACVMAILSLPLILLLVYKQRQTGQSSRRAHELVRMDSEAQGHENPVFLRGSPPAKTRTVSQIMTRQSSETGHHLLSEPGTPLSPPAHGDVFFPAHEPIPESPDFL